MSQMSLDDLPEEQALRKVRTSPRRLQAISFLAERGQVGATWRELGAQYGLHHGMASGVLSVLHDKGRIARLKEQRRGCTVYVLPEYVQDRTTLPPGARKRSIWQQGYDEGFAAALALQEAADGETPNEGDTA